MTDITELKRLSEAATPGPWHVDETNDIGVQNKNDCRIAVAIHDYRGKTRIANAAYIAAANPAAVLELIELNADLLAALIEARKWIGDGIHADTEVLPREYWTEKHRAVVDVVDAAIAKVGEANGL